MEKRHPVMKCFRTVSIVPYSGSQTRLSRSSWESFPSVHKPRMKTLTKPHTDLAQLIRVSITILEGILDKNSLPKVSWLSEYPKSVYIWLQAQYSELSDSLRKWRELRGSQLSTLLQSLEGLCWPEVGLGIAEPSSRVYWVLFPQPFPGSQEKWRADLLSLKVLYFSSPLFFRFSLYFSNSI